jgi:hypothetical protein
MITEQQAIAFQGEDWFTIEPNDRYNFVGDTLKNPNGYAKASLFIGVGGDAVIVSDDGSIETFKNLASGTFLPCACVRVNETGTTATNIKGVIQKSKVL